MLCVGLRVVTKLETERVSGFGSVLLQDLFSAETVRRETNPECCYHRDHVFLSAVGSNSGVSVLSEN